MSMGGLPRMGPVRTVRTDLLEVGYVESGPPGGQVVLLLHGFPYDVHSYVDVAPRLAEAGWRVVVPYLRGHGPTRLLDAAAPRARAAAPRPASPTRRGRGGGNRLHSVPTSWPCSTRSASSGPCSPATTGAAARRASSQRCGRSGARVW